MATTKSRAQKAKKPGFKPQRKLYRLTFTDEEYAGLEVFAASISLGQILEIQRLAELMGGQPGPIEAMETMEKMIAIFVHALREWNLLDEDDQPVPMTEAGLADQEPDFVMAMVSAWTEAVSGVAAPLAASSPSGARFPEAALPMETLSLSRAS